MSYYTTDDTLLVYMYVVIRLWFNWC